MIYDYSSAKNSKILDHIKKVKLDPDMISLVYQSIKEDKKVYLSYFKIAGMFKYLIELDRELGEEELKFLGTLSFILTSKFDIDCSTILKIRGLLNGKEIFKGSGRT